MKPSPQRTFRRLRPEDRSALVPLLRKPDALRYIIHNLASEAEAGRTFAEANRLYPSLGYQLVAAFAPYKGMALSVRHRKELAP